jgi:hypothetical protein
MATLTTRSGYPDWSVVVAGECSTWSVATGGPGRGDLGEAPHLVSMLGAAYVRGLEQTGGRQVVPLCTMRREGGGVACLCCQVGSGLPLACFSVPGGGTRLVHDGRSRSGPAARRRSL